MRAPRRPFGPFGIETWNRRSNPRAELEGKQCLFAVNLPSRTMVGEQSEGMLLDFGFLNGIAPQLAIPEAEVPNGARAG